MGKGQLKFANSALLYIFKVMKLEIEGQVNTHSFSSKQRAIAFFSMRQPWHIKTPGKVLLYISIFVTKYLKKEVPLLVSNKLFYSHKGKVVYNFEYKYICNYWTAGQKLQQLANVAVRFLTDSRVVPNWNITLWKRKTRATPNQPWWVQKVFNLSWQINKVCTS